MDRQKIFLWFCSIWIVIILATALILFFRQKGTNLVLEHLYDGDNSLMFTVHGLHTVSASLFPTLSNQAFTPQVVALNVTVTNNGSHPQVIEPFLEVPDQEFIYPPSFIDGEFQALDWPTSEVPTKPFTVTIDPSVSAVHTLYFVIPMKHPIQTKQKEHISLCTTAFCDKRIFFTDITLPTSYTPIKVNGEYAKWLTSINQRI